MSEQVEVLRVPSAAMLDEVIAYWHNVDIGKGYVTLICWGSAWTCYFGAMGGNTIQEFFAKADCSYLINKLGNAQWLKQSKRHELYLKRIIVAVKKALAPPPAAGDARENDGTAAARKD